jgi:hypothetical protein
MVNCIACVPHHFLTMFFPDMFVFGHPWVTRDTPDSGSLSSLNIVNNGLKVEGAKHIAQVLPKW